MKFKLLFLSIVFLTAASCNQSRKNDTENNEDTTSLKQEKLADVSTKSEYLPGVYFVNLKAGDKLKSPVIVQMGVQGMTLEPAGTVNEGKGHHHIIIDGAFIEKGQVVPMDKTHLHFGKGQTTDTLKLSPGAHTLTLQFANGVHASYGKDWSKTIEITVME